MAKQWIQCGIGVWIMISPWLLGFSEIFLAKWSNVIFGIILISMSVWAIFGAQAEAPIEEKGRANRK